METLFPLFSLEFFSIPMNILYPGIKFSKLVTNIDIYIYREMLTSVLNAMVKEANIVISHWNLCIQLLKSLKNGIFNFFVVDIFNLKLSLFGFLNHCAIGRF